MFTLTAVTPSRLTELFRKAKLLIDEEGFLSLFPQLFLSKNYYSIYENTLDGPKFPSKLDNLTLKVITSQKDLDQLSVEGFSISESIGTLLGERIIFCACVGKEIVHRTSVYMRRSGVDALFCPSSMDDGHTAYLGGIWTAPEYRRKGINVFVSSKIFDYLREKGMSRAITTVIKGNIAEENSQLKLGSHLWEGCHLRLLFLFNFWWVKRQSRVTFGGSRVTMKQRVVQTIAQWIKSILTRKSA